ncbi:MAG: branched-chain amino acid transaminase [Planctomycetes bacterium]|nr:branched-chain amino acid transaminase [Planctomycetota bacterium]
MPEIGTQVWLDGKLVPSEQATVHVLTHTLHYGYGVFEGIRSYEGERGAGSLFRLREHLQRLFDSAKILKLEIPFSAEALSAACRQVLRANGLKEGYLRPLVFLGHGKMGLGAFANPVRVAIAGWVWGAYLGDDGMRDGIRAKVSSFTRIHPNSNMARGKIVGQYVNSILAKREAVDGGYDECILLDHQGWIAEGSGENIFVVREGKILTPPLSSPILAGVTRDTIIRLAKDEGYELHQCNVPRDELYTSDEVFLTGTAAEVTPVREVDDRPVGTGRPGAVTRRLQKLYRDVVRGKEPRYADWLTPIEGGAGQ